jgi:hypothetical protein
MLSYYLDYHAVVTSGVCFFFFCVLVYLLFAVCSCPEVAQDREVRILNLEYTVHQDAAMQHHTGWVAGV